MTTPKDKGYRAAPLNDLMAEPADDLLVGQLRALRQHVRSGDASPQCLATWEALRQSALGAGAMLYREQALISREAALLAIRTALSATLARAGSTGAFD